MLENFSWRPGIGDPSFGGWITVALYVLAGVSCWRTAGVEKAVGVVVRNEASTWRLISVAFFALGFNKQLDLQSALTEIGRVVALSGGWYDQRRMVQLYFILAMLVIAAAVIPIVLFKVRKLSRQVLLALAGSMFVFGYVVIRAASFHHFDRFIGSRILGLQWNWILEITGIVLVALASEWRRMNISRQNRCLTGEQH